ncbi:Imm1 family immunity protein [Mycobacterium sp. SMC-11]|uniref:Imm1 family immunity protein n=1 Tax=Mycobacterium sp. SMC-11 TaxID=3385969 RepID=UPI00390CBC4B
MSADIETLICRLRLARKLVDCGGHQRGGLLLFADNDRSQPPLHSAGDGDAGDDEVEFACGDATFGFFRRCLVDRGVMPQAAREFFDTGTLPTYIGRWLPQPSDVLTSRPTVHGEAWERCPE